MSRVSVVDTLLGMRSADHQSHIPIIRSEDREGVEKNPDTFVWPDGRIRKSLDIVPHLEECGRVLNDRSTLLLNAPGGSGKTTYLPPYIHLLRDEPVTLAVPTRGAVVAAAERIAQELNCAVGDRVGWNLAGERSRTGPNTKIECIVDATLARRIIANGCALPPGITIIDEADTDSGEMVKLLALASLALKNSPNSKLVVTSATLNCARFGAYFEDCGVVQFTNRSHEIVTTPFTLLPHEHHTQGVARKTLELVDRLRNGNFTLPGADTPLSSGAILAFAAGKADIDEITRIIRSDAAASDLGKRLEIVPCHGALPIEQQLVMTKPFPNDTIRVVVATEVARRSYTPHGVVAVVDCSEVHRRCLDRSGFPELRKMDIPPEAAEQARVRVGRERPGFYYPVVSIEDGSTEERADTPRRYRIAVEREGLTDIALSLARVGNSIRNTPLIQMPAPISIEAAISELQRFGALDENEVITPLGVRIEGIPLPTRMAVCLIRGEDLGIAPEVAIAGAGLLDECPFIRYSRSNQSAQTEIRLPEKYAEIVLAQLPEFDRYELDCRHAPDVGSLECVTLDLTQESLKQRGGRDFIARSLRSYWGKGSTSDYAALVGCVRDYVRIQRSGLNDKQMRVWCEMVGLDATRMKRIVHHANLVRDSLRSLKRGEIWEDRDFDTDALTRALLAGEYIGCGRVERGNFFKTAAGVSTRLSHDSLCSGHQIVLLGGIGNVNTGKDAVEMTQQARYAAPLDPAWILESAPKSVLATRPIGGKYYDNAKGHVSERVAVLVRGIEIGECERAVSPSLESARIFWGWALQNTSALPEEMQRVLGQNRLHVEASIKLMYLLNSEESPLAAPGSSTPVDIDDQYIQWLIANSNVCCSEGDLPHPDKLRLPADEFMLHFMSRTVSLWRNSSLLDL